MAAGSDSAQNSLHATAIVVLGRAALIRGPSGSGKSDLALRCLSLAPSSLIPGEARLIADDRVIVERCGPHLVVSAPSRLAGLLEVRGLGIVPLAATVVPSARLVLVVDLVAQDQAIERLPDQTSIAFEGQSVAYLQLHPFEASAPVKLLLRLLALEVPLS